MRHYRMRTLRLRMCWAASDLESVELYPLHIGPEYLAELGQIPLDPAPWSEQLDMRLIVASPVASGIAQSIRFSVYAPASTGWRRPP
jgi:hypothetical protein